MPQRLSLSLVRQPRETFAGFCVRLAHHNDCSLAALTEAIGLRGQTLPVIFMPDSELQEAAEATGNSPASLTAGLLSRYSDALPSLRRPASLPQGRGRAETYAAQHADAQLTTTRACPACLAANTAGQPGVWLVDWRLTPLPVCLRHQLLLIDTCPACARSLGGPGVRRNARELAIEPTRCAHALRRGRRPQLCGAPLTSAATPSVAAGGRLVAAQRKIHALLAAGDAGREPLADIRALSTLLLAFAPADRLGPLEPAASETIERYAHSRHPNRQQRFLHASRGPRSAALSAALLPTATELAQADTQTLHDQLEAVFAEQLPDAGAVQSKGLSSHLRRAFRTETRTRAPTRLLRPARVPAQATGIDGLTIANIPQLFWQPEYEQYLARLHQGGEPTPFRRFASTVLALRVGSNDWQSASRTLDLPPMASSAGYFRRRLAAAGTLDRFLEALEEATQARLERNALPDYATRRRTLRTLTSATLTTLDLAPSTRTLAAIWLWTSLTDGDPVLAPAAGAVRGQGAVAQLRRRVHAFACDNSTWPLRQELLAIGEQLLTAEADVEPDLLAALNTAVVAASQQASKTARNASSARA